MKLSAAIKTLRESKDNKEKCKTLLIYIRSNAMSAESSTNLSEKQYNDMCKSIVSTYANGGKELQSEACTTLGAILVHFKDHKLDICQELLQVNYEDRIEICHTLAALPDDGMRALARDVSLSEFVQNCLNPVTSDLMKWLLSEYADNSEVLESAENRLLSSIESAQEKIVNSVLCIVHRMYTLSSSITHFDFTQFDCLFLDKIAMLAYMGHKRQRSAAIKVLQISCLGSQIRTRCPNMWLDYKNMLQNTFCRRMSLLVGASEPDWSLLWSLSVRLLGTDLHRGAGLINNLLSVEERAFKSTDPNVRRHAFLCWSDIVDNFALDEQELATARRVKLLCIPLNAKNSKTEAMTLTKLDVWWHLVNKLLNHIDKFINPVLTQFLNFCFGPLGDTPLLSSKFNVMASPGKRFPKTKIISIDALLQLLSENENDLAAIDVKLNERIAGPISELVFQECSKSFIHSVGEALLALSQLGAKEISNRNQIAEILWRTLLVRVNEVRNEVVKTQMFKDITALLIELADHGANKTLIRDAMVDIILPSLSKFPANFIFNSEMLQALVSLLIKPGILIKINRTHYDVIKHIMWQGVKPNVIGTYLPETLELFHKIVFKIEPVLPNPENIGGLTEIWYVTSEMVTRYMLDAQEINEGDAASHDFTTVQTLIKFPFSHKFILNPSQLQRVATTWKNLFKQFDLHANLIPTVKPNEVLLLTVAFIQDSICVHKRNSALAVFCLDGVLATINYKHLLAQNKFLPVIKLIGDMCIHTLGDDEPHTAEAALKELSSVLITFFGHAVEKIPCCLESMHPVIKCMLQPYTDESLMREIASTWETIISILKGVSHLISYDLMSVFQGTIRAALQHKDQEIVSQTVSWLAEHKFADPKTKALVDRLLSQVDLVPIENKTVDETNSELVSKQPKQVKPTTSFLNRRLHTSRPVASMEKPSVEKKSPFTPDSKTQEYVLIKNVPRLDVNRLTEHQKECLLRRREDIPALYNDLSQSCSQDMEHIQEWFDKRNTDLEKRDKLVSNIAVTTTGKSLDTDANKENKLVSKIVTSGIGENLHPAKGNTKRLEPETQTVMDNEVCSEDVNVLEVSQADSTEPFIGDQQGSVSIKNVMQDLELPHCDDSVHSGSADKLHAQPENDQSTSVAKKLDFESRVEFSEKEINDEKHASMSNETDQERSKTDENSLQSSSKTDTRKRGVKRKAISDIESDANLGTRRRRKAAPNSDVLSDSDSVKSTESEQSGSTNPLDSTFTPDGLNKRTKNEMSRLQINMVFDTKPLSNRRSKLNEDDNIEKDPNTDKVASAENKTSRSRTADHKPGDPMKKFSRSNELKSSVSQESLKRRIKFKTHEEETREDMESNFPATTACTMNSNENDMILLKSPLNSKDMNISTTTAVAKADNNDHVQVPENLEAESYEAENIITETPVTTNATVDALENNDNAQVNSEDLDDVIEIVESSQDFPVSPSMDRKYTNKQCFIKMNKIPRIKPGQTMELDIGNERTKVTKALESNSTYKIFREVHSGEIDDENSMSELLNINADNTAAHSTNEKSVFTSEVKKTEDSSTTEILTTTSSDNENMNNPEKKSSSPEIKQLDDPSSPIRIPDSLLNTSSPKNNRRFSKLKSVTPQGRAAHMLGMVTKQALVENKTLHCSTDDESLWHKKQKNRDNDGDNTAIKKDRQSVLKEADRLGSPSSSRQEKIFSKMKTPDGMQSISVKLFSSSKVDNDTLLDTDIDTNQLVESMICETDDQNEKVNDEDISLPLEKEPLPMLEWSSANPPSLTASPSASILKRYRHSLPDIEPECSTPSCKRKRVSFADPPVSMEMGYEISASMSPHRMSKLATSRNSLPRKETPVRLKQTRLKMIQFNSGNSDKEIDIDLDKSDIPDYHDSSLTDDAPKIIFNPQIQAVRINDDNAQASYINDGSKVTVSNLNMEIEIASGFHSRNIESIDSPTNATCDTISKKIKFDETETQRDMFDSINPAAAEENPDLIENEKTENKRKLTKALSADDILRDVKSNVINMTIDDEIDANICSEVCDEINANTKNKENHRDTTDTFPMQESNSEQLEDTVDIQNLTGINSTLNSDEIFCVKPVRTSTYAAEAAANAESDTLPVTDSVFSSLPASQISETATDSRSQLDKPWMKGDKQPVFPSLVSSTIPIDSIIGNLAKPLWKSYLATYFRSKGIETVGNLAQLSEHEISWIPVKGSSKVEFVKQILRRFEKSLPYCDLATQTEKSYTEPSKSETVSPNISLCSLPTSSPLGQSSAQSVSPGTSNTSLLNETSILSETEATSSKSTETQVSVEDLLDEIDASLTLKSAIKRCSAEKILAQYKLKMKNMAEDDLERETVKMLGIEPKNHSDAQLKSTCRACGLNKVLGRLPDIFSNDKQFFSKVFKAYRKKLSVKDCIKSLSHEEVKTSVCEKCTSSELAEMLSRKLKYEEERGITTPMTELSSLNAMLKRMPKDLIISHTVANEELISPLIVLDIALQNNSPTDISLALDAQPSNVKEQIFGDMFSVQTLTSQIQKKNLTEDNLIDLLKAVSSTLPTTKLLDTFNTILKSKWHKERPDK